ncbi:MAG: tRNA pseudouridine(55) synthase TruB [Planctomycetota bacterium]
MFGLLNLNKPAGWTSRDVVNRVQRFVRPAKVGHAGTLDPLATGVLVVCIGPATRLISHVQQQSKCYDATFLLGCTSPSDDTESDVVPIDGAHQPTICEIESALPRFVGRIDQLPPQYSALKVDGERAYKLARRGEEVALEPRTVEVYELVVHSYDYPDLRIRMRCGSGTYVRSVGRDLARSLGTGAVMSALTRTAIGDFRLCDAHEVESLDVASVERNMQPPLRAVPHLRQMQLGENQLVEIRNGRQICATQLTGREIDEGEQIAAVDERGNLVALLTEKQTGRLGPSHNFPQPD